jgi:endonuclease YncB( thermonuclease family)
MLAGKDVKFCNFTGAGKKQEAHIYLGDQNVAVQILRAGYANLDEDPEERRQPSEYDDYLDANREAKAGTKGIYSGSPKKYGSNTSLPTNVEDLYKVTRDKTFSGYIDDCEYNFNFKMFIKEYENTMNILIKGITVPIISADHAKLIRGFLYKNCIQQTLSYKVVEFSKDKDGLVVIEDNVSDDNSVTAKLLRAGFARIESGAAMKLDHSYFLSLKLHEDFAKSNHSQIWKDFAGNTGSSFTKSMFDAIVLEVHSADCVTVANSANPSLEPQRLYLSNIQAQSMGNVNIENSTQPWAFEGKEFLRNLIIGKTVKCELEFKREIPIKDEDGNVQKDKTIVHQCCSLFIDGKNVSVEVLINGFAKCTSPRGNDPFKHKVKEMNEAEDTAKKSGIAVHSKKTAPQHKYWDLTTPENRKKMKNFNLSGLNGTVMGVCEHVFNGARLKIRVDTEKYYINFQLNGIQALRNDENMPLKGKFDSFFSKFTF